MPDMIARLLGLTPKETFQINLDLIEEMSCAEAAKEMATKRVEEGSHNFLKENRSKIMNKNALDNCLASNKIRLQNGTHNLLGENQSERQMQNWFDGSESRERVRNKTHNFLKENGGSEIAKKAAGILVEKKREENTLHSHMKMMRDSQDYEKRSKKHRELGTFAGKNNPAAISIYVDGVKFDTLREAQKSTNLSRYMIKKKINNNEDVGTYTVEKP